MIRNSKLTSAEAESTHSSVTRDIVTPFEALWTVPQSVIKSNAGLKISGTLEAQHIFFTFAQSQRWRFVCTDLGGGHCKT